MKRNKRANRKSKIEKFEGQRAGAKSVSSRRSRMVREGYYGDRRKGIAE
jgi:hypothetical protein